MKYGGLVLVRLCVVFYFLWGLLFELEIISEKKLERGVYNFYFLSECFILWVYWFFFDLCVRFCWIGEIVCSLNISVLIFLRNFVWFIIFIFY